MSLVFNDTTNKRGIIQMIEDKAGFNDGDVTGSSLRFKKWTARVNNAMDAALVIIFRAGGTWQFDDSNQTDYPIIYADIVNGQSDYSFVGDADGNLILGIDRVFRMKANAGIYEPIEPVDVASDPDVRASFYDNLGVVGIPTQYDKTANGILFDLIPNYSATQGIKIYISRESTYFTTADTTKKPGFAGLFHRYLAVHAVEDWGKLNLPTGKYNAILNEKLQLEKDIEAWYGQREKDVRPVLKPSRLNPRTGKRREDELYPI